MINSGIMDKEIIVYLLDYKYVGDNVYSEAYIDFRTIGDLRRFNRLMNLNLMEETVLQLSNFSANKRLRRGAYYLLNVDLLRRSGGGYAVDGSLFVGYGYDLSGANWGNAVFLLDVNRPLERQDVIFENHATAGLFAPLEEGLLDLKLRVNDVGQGNCNEILSGNAVRVVYDIGATMSMRKEQLEKIKDARIGVYRKSHPLLVISHWDVDHFVQLKVMSEQEMQCFSGLVCSPLMPSVTSQKMYRRLETALGRERIESLEIAPAVNHNTEMDLFDRKGTFAFYYGKKASTSNHNYGCITVFVHGDTHNVFLAGDCNYTQVTDVLSQESPFVTTDVNHILLVPHHGAKFSQKFNVLDIPHGMNAEEAVISVDGNANSYGHPTEETLAMLRGKFGRVRRTDVVGDIVCDL